MNLKEILKKRGIHLKKELGQNFFVGDKKKLLSKTIITNEDLVIEVGTGTGELTRGVASKAKFVITYEIDERFRDIIYKNLKDVKNVRVKFMDFLKEEEFPRNNLIFFSNLPYSSGTEILKKVARINSIKRGYFMIQRELGERIVSPPSRKTFSAISIFLQTFFSFRKLMDLSRKNFFPLPDVDSSFFEFKRKRNWSDDWKNYEGFLKRIFSMRRKKVKSSIFSFVGRVPEIDVNLRAENLSVEEYIKIYEIFSKGKGKSNP